MVFSPSLIRHGDSNNNKVTVNTVRSPSAGRAQKTSKRVTVNSKGHQQQEGHKQQQKGSPLKIQEGHHQQEEHKQQQKGHCKKS
jgi:hypothetical protein